MMAEVWIGCRRAVRRIRLCSRVIRLHAVHGRPLVRIPVRYCAGDRTRRHAPRRPLRRLTTIMIRATTRRM